MTLSGKVLSYEAEAASCSLVPTVSWRVLLSFCFSEMSPVCAVVGGVLGQEIVKVSTRMYAQIWYLMRN